ncbi:MAG: eukaryotic-like serine/threonine-protein kinase [Thermoleophilaceae bacterium]|nr:eukaryotic-like serine/threonine-protein kinase [Thermoleophilaceae bacterium]
MIGTLLANRFRLEEKIGSGGMSTVYRAFDETLERSVAIKVLHADMSQDDSQLERFRREARAAARLSHPHVVTVIDAGEDDGRPFIVFEYVEGETLKERIRRVGRLPVAEAIAYAIEMGRALMAAHAERIVHRDVKPQNVLIDAEGRAKVTDFGIARSLELDGLTAAGRVLGTTDYVAPEQAIGDGATQQADIYSLGICLWEMLTGDVPFKGDNQVAVAMQHVRDPLPDVQHLRPEVSSVLASVVDRATRKELKNRYGDVSEMVHDLEQALAIEARRGGQLTDEATTVLRALPGDTAGWVPLRIRAPRRILALAGLMLVAAAVVVAVLATRTHTGETGDAAPRKVAAGVIRVQFSGVHDYDPQGDQRESPNSVRLAIDGNRTTKWATEHYSAGLAGANKTGVGLWVSTGKPVAATELDIISPFAGWQGMVYGADGKVPKGIGGWQRLSTSFTAKSVNKIPLDTAGHPFDHYLVWVTKLAGEQAGIMELSLLAQKR